MNIRHSLSIERIVNIKTAMALKKNIFTLTAGPLFIKSAR